MATYYEILDVDRSASKQDIKLAFKKLAVKYHPDHNPNNSSAEEIFKQINEAYQVLSNDVKKHDYDLGLDLLDIRPKVQHPTYTTSTYTHAYRPPKATSYEPYENTYDPANYVSKSLKLKIKIFAGVFLVLMVLVGVIFHRYMSQVTAESHYKEARAFYEEEKYRAALVEIVHALEFDKYHLEARLLRASINSETYHNFIMALDDLEVILEHAEEPAAEVYYKIGKCYFHLYDFDKAIPELEKAIAGENTPGIYYYYLALAKVKSGKKFADICQNLTAAKNAGFSDFEDIDSDFCP